MKSDTDVRQPGCTVQDVTAVSSSPPLGAITEGLVNTEDRRVRVMECFHMVHASCFDTWCQSSQNHLCPECKSPSGMLV